MSIAANFVFLHGGGQGSWVWRETVQALEHQAGSSLHRVMCLDIGLAVHSAQKVPF